MKHPVPLMYAIFGCSVLATYAVAGEPATQLTATLPSTIPGYWTLGIAAVTPLIIQGVKKVMPGVPKWLLPCLTPFVGVCLGLLINWLGMKNFGWVDTAQAGALAVFIREVIDQAAKQQLAKQESAAPANPPTTNPHNPSA